MKEVVVYTMRYCPFCERAKALLKQRSIAFKEVLLEMDDEKKWDELEVRSGMKTMPQIFVGDQLIGGFNELSDQDQKDQLKSFR